MLIILRIDFQNLDGTCRSHLNLDQKWAVLFLLNLLLKSNDSAIVFGKDDFEVARKRFDDLYSTVLLFEIHY